MFRLLNRQNTNTDSNKPVVEFDKDTWEAFVSFVSSVKGQNNRIYIKYTYLNLEYSYLIYRYIVKDDKVLAINIFVPEHPKSKLSCNLINRVFSVADAINFVDDLRKGKLR